MATAYCPQCQAAVINGVPSHESGCQHEKDRWIQRGRGDNKVVIPNGTEVPEWLKTDAD